MIGNTISKSSAVVEWALFRRLYRVLIDFSQTYDWQKFLLGPGTEHN
jgi:hypothetical protein